MARNRAFPAFDADDHLSETGDAISQHPPDRCEGAIDDVEVRGRTQTVVRPTVAFNEHGDAVLAELGFDWDAIVDLKVRGTTP